MKQRTHSIVAILALWGCGEGKPETVPLPATPSAPLSVPAEAKATPPVPTLTPKPAVVSQPTLENLVGTWNLVSKVSDSYCTTHNPDSINAYIWIVGGNDQFGPVTLTASVQGSTAFPELRGTLKPDGRIVLQGDGTQAGQTSLFELRYEDGKLVGNRYYLGYETRRLTNGAEGVVSCFIRYNVVASR